LADEITTSRLNEYIAWRREQPKRPQSGRYARRSGAIGAANATINRELAALRQAFRLASQDEPPLVAHVPHIELLKERNRRTGFFEWLDFEAVRCGETECVSGRAEEAPAKPSRVVAIGTAEQV
jgi:hypothetical protein